jgi:hypothetical protein
MWLCREVTSHSFPEIGDAFGGRDHTTVIHAVKTIDSLRSKENELNHDLHVLLQVLKGEAVDKAVKSCPCFVSHLVKPALWENYPDFIHRQSRDFRRRQNRFNTLK